MVDGDGGGAIPAGTGVGAGGGVVAVGAGVDGDSVSDGVGAGVDGALAGLHSGPGRRTTTTRGSTPAIRPQVR